MESLGTITGKYPAKDKITSSAVDLLGEDFVGYGKLVLGVELHEMDYILLTALITQDFL